MVGSEGVEPSTKRLRVSCSTTELQTHLFFSEDEYAHDLESGKLNMHREMQSECAAVILPPYAAKLSPQEQVTMAFGFFTLKPPF